MSSITEVLLLPDDKLRVRVLVARRCAERYGQAARRFTGRVGGRGVRGAAAAPEERSPAAAAAAFARVMAADADADAVAVADADALRLSASAAARVGARPAGRRGRRRGRSRRTSGSRAAPTDACCSPARRRSSASADVCVILQRTVARGWTRMQRCGGVRRAPFACHLRSRVRGRHRGAAEQRAGAEGARESCCERRPSAAADPHSRPELCLALRLRLRLRLRIALLLRAAAAAVRLRWLRDARAPAAHATDAASEECQRRRLREPLLVDVHWQRVRSAVVRAPYGLVQRRRRREAKDVVPPAERSARRRASALAAALAALSGRRSARVASVAAQQPAH